MRRQKGVTDVHTRGPRAIWLLRWGYTARFPQDWRLGPGGHDITPVAFGRGPSRNHPVPQGGHHDFPGGRAATPGHVRPETRRSRGDTRRVPANRHQCSGARHLRTHAAARRDDGPIRADSLSCGRRRRPFGRPVFDRLQRSGQQSSGRKAQSRCDRLATTGTSSPRRPVFCRALSTHRRSTLG
jgi:hypothetical protein